MKPENLDDFFDDLLDTTDEQDLEFEKMVINSDFSSMVRDLMDLKGMSSQKDLAKQLGISASHLSKVLASDKYFNIELMAKLQRVFKTKIVFNANSLIKKNEITLISDENVFNINYFYESDMMGSKPNNIQLKENYIEHGQTA